MARLLIAAPHKSSGKTTLTLALCAALAERGVRVQPFKKGPDYIDPMWLAAAAGRPCYNLDFNVQSHTEIRRLFNHHAGRADISLIEGNMGLFDSLDIAGEQANAALARVLQTPILLVVDAAGATRSLVPLIRGFLDFEPDLPIVGLLLNRVAGRRHEQRLREVIGHYIDRPIVGAIHRDESLQIEERHLGLIPSNEAVAAQQLLRQIRDRIAPQIDFERLCQLAATAPPLPFTSDPMLPPHPAPDVRIGIASDAAFGFYYPGDLDALQVAGARLIPFSPISDSELPKVDALFIGGGFPETQMVALEANRPLRQQLRVAIEAGMPVYAECGGLMYLSRCIHWQGRTCEMVGAIAGDTVLQPQPVGRGLARVRLNPDALWRRGRATLSAHEFHYSRLINLDPDLRYAYQVERGVGIDGTQDGIIYHNLLASYLHLRDVAADPWASQFVAFVRARRGRWSLPASID